MRLFTVFHLNISFSSVEESQRPDIVKRCYWPLLKLIETSALRAGIEAPAYTLEVVDAIDPQWTASLRALIVSGKVEFIGSGYSQLIGPLVPAAVNEANLRIGNRCYEELIGSRPRVALVNEQAYASSLISHYLGAGYAAIVMEWNNAARAHPEWPRSARLSPSIAADQHGQVIPLLWIDSVAFQKFQRYAHDEMELAEYLAYLGKQVDLGAQAFCLYGNDVEIFDFRPGRFAAEPVMTEASEWARLHALVDKLSSDSRFTFALPSEVLVECSADAAVCQLESAEMPILVKKQPKYNLTRWAVTGRDDLGINSACWRIYEGLVHNSDSGDDAWRELCYLWSSDFRTHITAKRWNAFRERLRHATPVASPKSAASPEREVSEADSRVSRERRRMIVRASGVEAVVNLRRGLALDKLIFPELSELSLAGTITHGTLDDIALSADWYTGNLVLESPGAHKVTDLESAQDVRVTEGPSGALSVSGVIASRLGPIHKSLHFGSPAGSVELRYRLDWPSMPYGSLRLGLVTLSPEAFDGESLYYRTHNGGHETERFPLANRIVEHGAAVSFLVSASHALGVTGGVFDVGDAHRTLRVEIDKGAAALVAMVTHRRVANSFFCQVQFSAMELDDTSVASGEGIDAPRDIILRISGRRTDASG